MNQLLGNIKHHIQSGFRILRTKLHLDEVASGIIEVISEFHRHVGHFIEATTKKIPLVNLLIDAIGNIAAIVTIRQKKTTFEKRALGAKVAAGLITGAMTIAAFVVPQVAIPLIIIGSLSSLFYSAFSIYKTKHRLNQLEHTLNHLDPNATNQRAELQQKITELNSQRKAHNHAAIHKSVKTITSTIAFVGAIIMLANPITVIPVSMILAITAVAYTAYHFRQPISNACKYIGNALKKVFTRSNNEASSLHTATVSPANNFLNAEQQILGKAMSAHHESFAQHHADNHVDISQQVADFLSHEEHTLENITTQSAKPKPEPESIKKAKIEEEEEDDEGGGSTLSGISIPELKL